MIIYGTKARQIAKDLVVEKCPNCGNLNSVEVYVFQKYAHVFWIPFFPTGKTGVSQCNHCKQTLKLKEMPASLESAYQNLKQQSKAPLWTFSGIALVAILIIIAIISDKNNDAKNEKLIASPQKGDVYEIKTPENQYTLYKVAEVKGDSVFVLTNQFEVNKSTALNDIRDKGDAAYFDTPSRFSKADIKGMLAKGEIRNVVRK